VQSEAKFMKLTYATFKIWIFQTRITQSNKIYSLKYHWSTILGCKDFGIRNSEFVASTQFLCLILVGSIVWNSNQSYSILNASSIQNLRIFA